MHDAQEMRQLFVKRILGSCYNKVVHVNLRKDSFHIIKLDDFEREYTTIDLKKATECVTKAFASDLRILPILLI